MWCGQDRPKCCTVVTRLLHQNDKEQSNLVKLYAFDAVKIAMLTVGSGQTHSISQGQIDVGAHHIEWRGGIVQSGDVRPVVDSGTSMDAAVIGRAQVSAGKNFSTAARRFGATVGSSGIMYVEPGGRARASRIDNGGVIMTAAALDQGGAF
jgi:hypothetical protein